MKFDYDDIYKQFTEKTDSDILETPIVEDIDKTAETLKAFLKSYNEEREAQAKAAKEANLFSKRSYRLSIIALIVAIIGVLISTLGTLWSISQAL